MQRARCTFLSCTTRFGNASVSILSRSSGGVNEFCVCLATRRDTVPQAPAALTRRRAAHALMMTVFFDIFAS